VQEPATDSQPPAATYAPHSTSRAAAALGSSIGGARTVACYVYFSPFFLLFIIDLLCVSRSAAVAVGGRAQT
jgi:hypothetical protein